MYWIEWMLWYVQTSRRNSEMWQEEKEKYLAEKLAGKYKHEDDLPGIRDRVSEAPCADGSIYEFNETYIEIMAGESQERRGVITYLTVFTIYLLCTLSGDAALDNTVWFTGVYYWGKDAATVGDYVFAAFTGALTVGCFYVVIRYARIFINLENFVQRRMLIRFNRVTRQVYLHRPQFAGGITVLDWEKVIVDAGVGHEEGAHTGTKLILLWEPSTPDHPYLHMVFVGKRVDGTSDMVNLWEFIRRYMEEGPQSVPAPKKLLGKVPWPWLSVMAPLSFFRPLWRAGMRWQVACIVALTSPALALHAVGHWISLLLCWEPRWPRIIREAGLPGKPVPQLSTAADWPPLPKVEPAGKKPRRARRPAKSGAQSGEQASQEAGQSTPESMSGLEPDVHRQELK
ncbi:DUF6708 domain-containing protein [Pseudomonas sp. 5P_5.1_Bac1]|uniref:DUF6708 domain-containing protein n=1 Tax=Pseudomonas sp. 5P_5.1_Bac1 TaxID=2971616 RepID=UPI0021C68913|nr:DUF6708 domain-containing protein [Pseudomonas sp. 5P_5.1_Bac1]MCU1722049.1 hypothetical protein [Pseudomonas sp. 5P_5.1_Bac1]